MQKDIKAKNFATFKTCLIKLANEAQGVSEDSIERLVESLGGEEAIMEAPFASKAEDGSAEDGALVKNVIKLTKIAKAINEILPEGVRADEWSLNKVCFLSHLAKALMYEPNDSTWEVNNKGIMYKFVELEGALRVGERSALLASNAGIQFTPEEYEAMRVFDKSGEEDTMLKFFSSPISVVVRQANELLFTQNRTEWKNKTKSS